MPGKNPARMEFHISRTARDRYQFDQSLFSLSGNVVIKNFHSARIFAQKMNNQRDLINFPERAVRAGQINAMGLIDEILHFVIQLYARQNNPDMMTDAMDWLEEQIGPDKLDKTLRMFVEEFPTVSVYRRNISGDDYLEGESTLPDGRTVSNRQIALEEMLALWLANANPAFDPFRELFSDDKLSKETSFPQIITALHDFFEDQPPFGPDQQNLIDMLRSPAIAVPHSLSGQLEYIRTRWASLLGDFLYRLLSSLDFIKEEEKAIFLGPGPARVYEFAGMELEPERFSPDKDWMPNLVLIAKNTYVWLDQLAKKYQRPIHRLDQIPDEELDQLSRWGFTGLWLIGLWERSEASKRIKQLRGNMEAVASAYSLFDYTIAGDLGGDDAYQDLRMRAWERGIRLASDMVPNHMGIDSKWVIEHPDWFVQLDYPPFPSYTFNGPNLSWDSRVGLFLEDHYYDNTDAAVIFKHVDFWAGRDRYIYHGNDGTLMPWNDTAQLNYLIPEVREAVIQTILHVARKFPIIRFDAAMTLAKKHYQRLWFPEPGGGGAIPSRAEHGLTKERFDELFPKEFWREVVDRVAQEVPDTLLLAEAFWLMEGYFVRTLGMHRVYNSAFMNMLRDEKNQEYRLVIKNTIEFDPEILKRYVNFMNNPDERTAVDQFGKGDKYFGVCTMMATMPGLPMFGHGQIEGYAERYGMEFRHAYWDERPDENLVERHKHEIFPLLHKRYLFAGVNNFLLYDFFTGEGQVNEDVYAYSNRAGDQSSLVVYHNRYSSTRGWIRQSAAYRLKSGGDQLEQKSLGESLGIHNDEDYFTIFRDHVRGLEFIRNSKEIHENGLYVELDAYQYYVFLDFREVADHEYRQYSQLAGYLGGRGVPSIEEALKELFLKPIHLPFHELVNPGQFRWLIENRAGVEAVKAQSPAESRAQALDEVQTKTAKLLQEVKTFINGTGEVEAIAGRVRADASAVLRLTDLRHHFPGMEESKRKNMFRYLQPEALMTGDSRVWGVLLGWMATHRLGEVAFPEGEDAAEAAETSLAWIDEWLLGRILTRTLRELDLDEQAVNRATALIRLLVVHANDCEASTQAYSLLQTWLRDREVQRSLGINRYQGILWFQKEAFEEFIWWMFLINLVSILTEESDQDILTERVETCYNMLLELRDAQEESGYQVEKLLEATRI